MVINRKDIESRTLRSFRRTKNNGDELRKEIIRYLEDCSGHSEDAIHDDMPLDDFVDVSEIKELVTSIATGCNVELEEEDYREIEDVGGLIRCIRNYR